jgi:hypothetical protein
MCIIAKLKIIPPSRARNGERMMNISGLDIKFSSG